MRRLKSLNLLVAATLFSCSSVFAEDAGKRRLASRPFVAEVPELVPLGKKRAVPF
jgi:hypothetical protein